MKILFLEAYSLDPCSLVSWRYDCVARLHPDSMPNNCGAQASCGLAHHPYKEFIGSYSSQQCVRHCNRSRAIATQLSKTPELILPQPSPDITVRARN